MHRINRRIYFFSKHFCQPLSYQLHISTSPDQNDLFKLICCDIASLQCLFCNSDSFIYHISYRLIELFPCNITVKFNLFHFIINNSWQKERRRLRTSQCFLYIFNFKKQTILQSRSDRFSNRIFSSQPWKHNLLQYFSVKITSPKEIITFCIKHLQSSVKRWNDRHVQSSSAIIKNHPEMIFRIRLHSVCNRCRNWLL